LASFEHAEKWQLIRLPITEEAQVKAKQSLLHAFLLLITLPILACATTQTGPGLISEQQANQVEVGQTIQELRAITGNPYSFADADSPADSSIWEYRVETSSPDAKPYLRVRLEGTPQRVRAFYRADQAEFADTIERQ
jgi:hypothetical protein